MTAPTTRSPLPTPAAGGEYAGVSSDLHGNGGSTTRPSAIVLSKTELTVDEGNATGQTYTVKLSHAAVGGRNGDGLGPGKYTDLSLTGLSPTNTLTFTRTNWEACRRR